MEYGKVSISGVTIPVEVITESLENAKNHVKDLLPIKYDNEATWNTYFQINYNAEVLSLPEDIENLRNLYWDLVNYKAVKIEIENTDFLRKIQPLLNSKNPVRVLMALIEIKNKTGYVPKQYKDLVAMERSINDVLSKYRRTD